MLSMKIILTNAIHVTRSELRHSIACIYRKYREYTLTLLYRQGNPNLYYYHRYVLLSRG